ncbi:MAG: molybdopterin biosynthesis protein, partial [Thermodesulfobacterium geofontis]
LLMSVVRADGYIIILSGSEGFSQGQMVDVYLWKEKEEIDNTIVCIGSHDNTLDILYNYLRKKYPKISLSSAHVGSMGGLIAIKKGEAHVAGTHLLDETTGEYNIPFIKRLLPEKKVILINLVYRIQGLIVRKGNPKNIKSFEDLVREDIIFINRQAGSGTRLLLDKHLREMGINSSEIKGYENEEYTHMGVAQAVASGRADVGLGILAAAKALDLDFIPITEERYDLLIAKDFLELESVQALLDIIRNDKKFKEAVIALGGYDVRDMGKIIYEN